MISLGRQDTLATGAERERVVRDFLASVSAVQITATVDPGMGGSLVGEYRTGSRLEVWLARGRVLILQVLDDHRGIDVYYPSPAFTMNTLMHEVRGYVAQGWDALRAGGSFR